MISRGRKKREKRVYTQRSKRDASPMRSRKLTSFFNIIIIHHRD